uniref:MlaD family protein n=1 Tax=Phocaeicola sp. TaxID=2773926 RepID=UPI003FEDB74D
MKYVTKEVKIACAGIAAVAVLFFGIKFLRGINMFKATNYYYVAYDNIGGLTVSSPVYADGYNIGIVRNIDYDHERPGHVTVEIDVEEGLRIPKGSQAELVTEMLGTVKMNLLLANNPRERVEVGDTIPGHGNNGLMGEAQKMIPVIQQMLPKMDSILVSLNKLLADPALAATLHNTEQITANLNTTTRQINHLMQNDIPQLTGKLNHISDNFVSISDNLAQTDYNAMLQRIDATLADITRMTDKLNDKDNTLGLLLNDSTLYNNLTRTTGNAADLLEDLQAHPKRYVHFSLFGRKDK